MLALVVIMAILLAWALVAGRLARWSITAPLTMVVAGVALTAGSNPVFRFDLETASSERVVEVVLAILPLSGWAFCFYPEPDSGYSRC